MPTYDVELKQINPIRVAAIRGIVPNYQSAGRLYRPLMQALKRHGLVPTGPRISLYYDEGYTARDVDMEAAVPVAEGTLPADEEARIRELPGGAMAGVVHRGPYDDFTPAYRALMDWIEQNGYRVAGPNREIYHQGPRDGVEPEEYITEIQFPVVKR